MSMDPLGGVVITSREIYDAVVRLTGRVDVLIAQNEEQRHDIQDHESRLRSLEEAQPARRLTALETGIEALKASRWPLPSLAVVIALGSLAYAALGQPG